MAGPLKSPPLQLVCIVGIVMFLLFVPSYVNFKATVHKANISFHLFLMILPLLLIFVAYFVSRCGPRLLLPVVFFGRQTRAQREKGGSSPWGLAALVVLLLVLASKLSDFRSMWSPLIWRPH